MFGTRFRTLSAGLLSLALLLGIASPASAEPELLTTLTAGSAPRFNAVSSDGSRLYVSNTSSASVTIFDTASRVAISTLTLPKNPYQLAISPDGATLYVGNYETFGSGTLWVVDVRNDAPTITATLSVGAGARDIAVTPDGQKVYVANSNSNTISVVTAATNAVQTIGPFPSSVGGANFRSPDQIAISPDGQFAYVSFSKRTADSSVAGVVRIQISTNTVDKMKVFSSSASDASQQPSGLALTSDGRYLYVGNFGSGAVEGVSKYDLTDADWLGTPVATIAASGPEFMALSADNSTLFIAPTSGTSLRIVDTSTNQVTQTIALPRAIMQVTAYPVGTAKYVFVGSWQGTPTSTDVYIVGTEATPLVESPGSGAEEITVPGIGLNLEGTVGSPINGKSVNFTVQKMAPSSQLTVTIEPGGIVLADQVVGPSGNASGRPVIQGLTAGSYSVVLRATGSDGQTYQLAQSFVVADDSTLISLDAPVGSKQGASNSSVTPVVPEERLAYTGMSSSQLPTWAFVFLLMGLVFVAYSVRARSIVRSLAVFENTASERSPWEILATPIRVPGIDYTPGSRSDSAPEAQSLSQTLHELDIALSRLLVRKMDRFVLTYTRG